MIPAVCVAMVLVSGCGASSTIDPVAQAASISTSTSGYQMRFSLQLSSPALPMAVTAAGAGSFDPPDRAGSLALGINLGSSPLVVQALGGSTLRIEELLDGSTVYMKLPPAVAGMVPGGKPWLKIDLADVAAAAGMPGLSSLASNPVSTDPGQFLEYLRAVSGHVADLGAQEIDGIPTTHYRTEIDLGRVPDTVPPASRSAAQQAVSALESLTHLTNVPVDVWIDDQHLVRRIRLSFGATLPSGVATNQSLTIDITEYGPQPKPHFPPAGQVTDLSTLAGASG